jgi:hypothetical protein
MANNIDLNIPNLLTPGTQYASEISEDLQQIEDFINAPFNIAGQSIANDLSLDGYNLTNVRGVQFLSQPSTLSGSQDVNEIYVNQNNLGFNNSNGIFVPITNGNTLAVTTLPFTNFSIRLVSSNATILNTDTYNVINVNTFPGPVTITLPIASTIQPIASGRLFLIRDVAFNAGTNNIIIQVAPGSGNVFGDTQLPSFTLASNGGYVAIYTDGGIAWFTWSQNTYDGETLLLESNSTLALAHSNLSISQGSGLSVDSTSDITINGGIQTFNGGTLVIAGASVDYSNGAAVTWLNPSTEVHQSGVIDTYNSGSNLVLNGTLSGSTHFTGNIDSASGQLTGNLILNNATLDGTLDATINFSQSGTIVNQGLTNQYGLQSNVTLVAQEIISPYVVDSSGYLDNVIGVKVVGGTGFVPNIWLPGAAQNVPVGRTITIMDVNGPDPTVASYSVLVSIMGANAGNYFANPGWADFVVGSPPPVYYPAPYFSTKYSTYLCQEPSGGATGVIYGAFGAFWSVTLMWNGTVWQSIASQNFYAAQTVKGG